LAYDDDEDDDLGFDPSAINNETPPEPEAPPPPPPIPVPDAVIQAMGQAKLIRDMMDPHRAAKALDVPVELYDALAMDGSRVQRRVVSMAAERLGLGVSTGIPNRLKIPFPKAGLQVMFAARTLGLIAGLYAHGGMMVRSEMMTLSHTFGDENMKFASRNRRIAQALPAPTFAWPPSLADAERYGANLLVSWAQDAAPALANLLKIAMPPAYGNHPMTLAAADRVSLDRLIVDVLEHFWGEGATARMNSSSSDALPHDKPHKE